MKKKYLFKVLNFIGVSRTLRWKKKNTITVLSLHRISNEKDYFWNPITPATFEKLLQYAIKYYTVISFKDISSLNIKGGLKPYMVLSFDDGYYDFYKHALPLLKKYDLPCNHNVVNECANNNELIWTQRLNIIFNHCKNNDLNLWFKLNGNDLSIHSFEADWMEFYFEVYKTLLAIPKAERLTILNEKEKEFAIKPECRMMTWAQIAECSDTLVEVGCHTYTHDVLSTIEDINILRQEILQSTDEIEKKIGKKVQVLALPNGKGNHQLQKVLEGSGIKYVLYANEKINKFSSVNSQPIKNIHRINVVEESAAEMILRIELFHSKLRKYA